MSIQWFPGHMTKAKRQMQEQLKAIDIVVELRDARIPLASENPLLNELTQHKLKVIIFSKADLADDTISTQWQDFFTKQNIPVLFVDSTSQLSKKMIVDVIEKAGAPRREKDAKRGIKNRALKVMIMGIPNVGKSTMINLLAKKKMAKVADRPGITRATTWINISKQLVLMDTPGVLWPKFDDQMIGVKLALTNAIKEQVLPLEIICEVGYNYLMKHYPHKTLTHFNLKNKELTYHDFLKHLALQKNMKLLKDELDVEKAQQFFFAQVKAHKLGKVSWERPDEQV